MLAELTEGNWIAIWAIIIPVIVATLGGSIKLLWFGKKDPNNKTIRYTTGDGQTIGEIQAETVNIMPVQSKNTETYTKAELDKKLDSFESKLEKIKTASRHLFKKEIQLYEYLWKLLIDVQSTAVITPTLDIMPKGKSPYDVYKGRFENAVDAFNKANDFFKNNRPFCHEDVSKITQELLSQCRGYIGSVGQMLKSENFDDELHDKADDLLEKIPEAINKIEEAIKRRIGLLQEAEIVE